MKKEKKFASCRRGAAKNAKRLDFAVGIMYNLK